MQNDFGVDVAGTTRALEKFSNNIRIKVTRTATRKAAKIIENAMILMAPRRSGALLESIRTKTKVDKAGGRAYAVVGPTGKVLSTGSDGVLKKRSQRYKARFLEYGTKNMKALPFIQASKNRSERQVEQVFSHEVEKALKKL